MKISAIILAAGQSRRMGRNKLALPVHGQSMLEKVIHTVEEADFGEIILVVNRENLELLGTSKIEGHVKVTINETPEAGAASSIREALRHVGTDSQGLAFIMADQPYMTAETMNGLIARFEENPDRIVIPQLDGQNGSPVIFPIDLLPAFEAIEGDVGGKQVIAQFPGRIMYHEVDSIFELKDIDTPEEYDKLTSNARVLVRGGGDLASGVIHELKTSGYDVLVAEIDKPCCIRTEVAFASALMEGGTKEIAGVKAQVANNVGEAFDLLKDGKVPILIDPHLELLDEIRPDVLVDAIMAKRNVGTKRSIAPLVVALGPGFTAGIDCHIAIETMRGPMLGELIFMGSPMENTGVPGEIAGEAENRVVYAQKDGPLQRVMAIGDLVEAGDTIATIDGSRVQAKIGGTLRGLIYDGYDVTKGLKIADVDPRHDPSLAFTISDKATKLGRSVIKAIIKAD